MKKLALVCASMALVLAGCGGGGRPSTDELESALKSSDNPLNALVDGQDDAVVTCVAEELEDSDLSDEALQAIVDGDEDFEGDADDEKALTDVQDDLTECLTDALD